MARLPRLLGVVLFILPALVFPQTSSCPDRDSDGFAVCGFSCLPAPGVECGDCNDDNKAINPKATEICNGLDDDCDGKIDLADEQFNDPDPFVRDAPPVDDDRDGDLDEGFGYCLFAATGPANECKTGGRLACVWPPGKVTVNNEFGILTCTNETNNILQFEPENLDVTGSCTNGTDDDCDGLIDVEDPECRRSEICDDLDNDGDSLIDEDFPRSKPGAMGQPCSAGVGECRRSGFYVCLRGGDDGRCNAFAASPKKEGSPYGDTCANGLDDDCDGLTDLADPGCAGYGQPELCGNKVDDNGDGVIDEGFPELGEPCVVGTGLCQSAGVYVCSNGASECGTEPGQPRTESDAAGTCQDFIDNDCDGLTDSKDPDCPAPCTARDSDLGVTCSLPYLFQGRTWDECRGRHSIRFSGGSSTDVKADLLALDSDGNLLGVIENVQDRDWAALSSSPTVEIDSDAGPLGKGRHTLAAPLPMLRVTGRKGDLVDVAYCSILPYMELTSPRAITLDLNDPQAVTVSALLPLVDVDELKVLLNGIDILDELGIAAVDVFPTEDACLCNQPGECVIQIEAGCGDGRLVDVEIRNLRVDGLDQGLAIDAFEGVGTERQSNTLSFLVLGLPPGGHKFHISGEPLPFLSSLDPACLSDDLTDTGTVSAFGIDIASPEPQEIVLSGGLFIEGTACGAREIASLELNGKPVDVTIPSAQTCQAETEFRAPECAVRFNERMPQHSLAAAVSASAPAGSFLRGSNRIIADAVDIAGGRAFNTATRFSLGSAQKPLGPSALVLEDKLRQTERALLPGAEPGVEVLDTLRKDAPERILQFLENDLRPALVDTLFDLQVFLDEEIANALEAAQVDPALMAGLNGSAIERFFEQGCNDAITRFRNDVQANLSGKTFGTFDVKPDCSCDLNNVPLVLQSIGFTGSGACNLDFQPGVIGLSLDLPEVNLQIGANRSCTTRGLFGECLARTRVNVTAGARILDVGFDYDLTEQQIETRTPASDAFSFTWDVEDASGEPLLSTLGSCVGGPDAGRACPSDRFCGPAPAAGTCSGGPNNGAVCSDDSNCPLAAGEKGVCFGGEQQGRGCESNADCPGGSCFSRCVGTCAGVVKNEDFDPVISADTPIECWGAWVCTIFDTTVRAIGVGIAEVFTLGFADTSGWIAGQFGIGGFEIEDDFLSDLELNKPDPMELGAVGLDPSKLASGGFTDGIEITPGEIDVEIEPQGLTVGIPAEFSIACEDPDIGETPGSAVTPARAPTVAELVNAGEDISLLVADDVFNQIFSGMKQCGDLRSFCVSAKGAATVGELLPADCETLPPIPHIQGICHAIRDADCDTIDGLPAERGVCHGFKGDDCTTLPLLQRNDCEATVPRNIRFDDAIQLCGKVDVDPEIGIQPQPAQERTIGFDIAVKQLNVVFELDRAGDGYAGNLSDLPDCFSAEGDSAPDCALYAACLDLALKTRMRLDNLDCSPQELGFAFDIEGVLPSNETLGVMCGAPPVSDDQGLLQNAFQSIVIDKIAENAQELAPNFCAEGMDLGGVLELIYSSAKLYGLVTDGVTPGFADYLGITVDLQAP
jgi:hypothetical protein